MRNFAALRTLYPDAAIAFLSRELETAARNEIGKLMLMVEKRLKQTYYFRGNDKLSSVGKNLFEKTCIVSKFCEFGTL